MTALASAAVAFATPAVAGVTFGPDQTGKPLTNQIYGTPQGQTQADAIHVFGSAPNNDGSNNVEFTGDTFLHITNGFAQIQDGGTTDGDLHAIVVNPNDLFSLFEFSTQLEGTAGTVYVYYLLAGSGLDANDIQSYVACGTNYCGTAGAYTSGQDDKANYLLGSDSGQLFDGFLIATSDSTFSLFQAKQLSYNGATPTPPVPEPGTWALMLLGFAGVGMTMRFRRRKDAHLAQIA
jgi:hypothetical protein